MCFEKIRTQWIKNIFVLALLRISGFCPIDVLCTNIYNLNRIYLKTKYWIPLRNYFLDVNSWIRTVSLNLWTYKCNIQIQRNHVKYWEIENTKGAIQNIKSTKNRKYNVKIETWKDKQSKQRLSNIKIHLKHWRCIDKENR